MKKLLSLLLVLFLVPMACMFSACKKAEGYKLSSLKTDLLAIADKYETVTIEKDNLKFDYSTLKNKDDTVIDECIKSVEPYKNVERYNQVFYNLMDFSFDYVGVCSNDSFNIDINVRNDLKQKLDALDSAIQVVDINVQNLSNILNSSADTSNIIYIERLDTVLNSYNRLFVAGSEFTNAVADLYFNKILIDANPDISAIKAEEFETSRVINTLDARTKNVVSILTQNYIEVYVSKANLVDDLLGNFQALDLNVNSYSNKVAKLKVLDLTTEANIDKAVEIANSESRKAAFYEKAIQAYNMQEIIQNDRASFATACNDVDYLKMKTDENASSYDKICIRIIENYSYITNEYAETLGELLDLARL